VPAAAAPAAPAPPAAVGARHLAVVEGGGGGGEGGVDPLAPAHRPAQRQAGAQEPDRAQEQPSAHPKEV
jgi:hypothetical protein